MKARYSELDMSTTQHRITAHHERVSGVHAAAEVPLTAISTSHRVALGKSYKVHAFTGSILHPRPKYGFRYDA